MSETVQSEVVKSVSEAGEFECHQNQGKYNSPGLDKKMQNSSQSHHHTLSNGNKSPGGGEMGTGSRTGSQFLPSLLNATLPSKIAIIVGLCQVAVGGAMVLTGILAIRYQSYLFHYGTGLWAGLVSAISGMLGAMCTKRGVPKPTWLGGRKWQIHVFLLAIVFSLSSVILLAIFSISGLLQDAKTIMAVEKDFYQSDLEELLESKNSSGILINTILLLLSVLQILLCFSSLGIAVRVMFKSKGNLLSSKGSSGSEIAIRDGLEYHARKDHLIHWLGNQGPNVIPIGGSPQKSMHHKYPQPSFVAIQPVLYPSPRMMIPYPVMHPHPPRMIPVHHPILSPGQFSFGPQHHGPTHLVPIYRGTPTPSGVMVQMPQPPRSRRAGSATPVSSIASLSLAQDHHNRRQRRSRAQGQGQGQGQNQPYPMRLSPPGVVSGNKTFHTHSLISKAPSMISIAKTESEKNNEVEVTEVDVSRTYTGLDRSIADEYISAMNSRKVSNGSNSNHQMSSISMTSSVRGEDEIMTPREEEDGGDGSDSEAEITRM